MKYEILFSANAKNDLISIVRYISVELSEPEIAEKVSQRMLKAIKSLEEFPNRYKLCDFVEWKEKGLRVVPVENYLVFYIADEAKRCVKIYRILYGKRDTEKQLKKELHLKNNIFLTRQVLDRRKNLLYKKSVDPQ